MWGMMHGFLRSLWVGLLIGLAGGAGGVLRGEEAPVAPEVAETVPEVAPVAAEAQAAGAVETASDVKGEAAPAVGAEKPDVAPAVAPVSEAATEAVARLKPGAGAARVLVIPIDEGIMPPILYVIRRGLKEAEEAGATAVVLDMNTPGGRLDVTLDIMEALDKFKGETLVYVNTEAISAGAIISSVVDEIHFAPKGIIGAAAAVGGGGEEISPTMKQKLNSYMAAKVASFNDGKGYRAQVIEAMMDADYEFKIGETVIKPKGKLLTLTSGAAAQTYGEPAAALLSAGTHETLEALLKSKYGNSGYSVTRLEVTWSERLARWLEAVAPILMGLGLLAIFIEFKTPGFGVFGITGGVLLALVFFGHYAAGLSGHEPALLFLVGVALVLVEILLVPGTLVAGLTGALLMLVSLMWSMIDVWPDEMPALDGDTLGKPFVNVGLAMVVAVVTALALGRFLPRGWFWDKMILEAAVEGDAGTPAAGMAGSGGADFGAPEGADQLLGATGVAVSALRPMGEVEVGGRRYEARADLGALERGETVRVVGRSGRTLIVAHDKKLAA